MMSDEKHEQTTISETVITFRILHRTDEPVEDLREALERSWYGHAVGLDDTYETTPVPDGEVADRLVALGNDGTFFNLDIYGEDYEDTGEGTSSEA